MFRHLTLATATVALVAMGANAQAQRAPATPAQTLATLSQISNTTYNLTIRDPAGNTLTGSLVVAGKSVERLADLATFVVSADAFDRFYNVSSAVSAYYRRFAVAGNYQDPVFIYAGNATVTAANGSVQLVIGIPVPGSLSEGGGVDSLLGNRRPGGSLVGSGNVQGFPKAFVATVAR